MPASALIAAVLLAPLVQAAPEPAASPQLAPAAAAAPGASTTTVTQAAASPPAATPAAAPGASTMTATTTDAPAPAAPADPAPGAGVVVEGSTGEAPKALEITANGYLDGRFSATHVVTGRPMPTNDLPTLANLTEANVQLKLRWGARGFVLADASYVYQAATLYYGEDAAGRRVALDDHDVPAYRPLAVVSELYGSYNFGEHANLTLGKKRIVWGPGQAVNPTDLLNPPKDPTDPTFQRAGAWLARAEFPFSRFTMSLVGAARATRSYGGLPVSLLYDPGYPTREHTLDPTHVPDDTDGQPHYAAAARVYALVADTDLQAFYTLTNLYNDTFERKSRFALTGSRLVGSSLEVHGEGLLQGGSARLYPDAACLAQAAAQMSDLPCRTRLHDGALRPRALLGARYTFADDAMLSLEYLYVGDGYTDAEFADYVRALGLAKQAAASGAAAGPAALAALGGPTDPGTPQKFTFDPLRRHYAFLSYMKPRIHEDFTLNAVAIVDLVDLSSQIAPSLSWSVREWVTVTAWLFVPLPGPESGAVDVDGTRRSEMGLAPFDARGMLSVRLFY